MNEMVKGKKEKLIKKLKKKPDVDNPWALANWIEKKQDKKMKKESIEGAIDSVYAVQKPYSGCQLTSLVQPIDPLVGLGGSKITSDNIHATYPDQETAQRVAETLYKEFQVQEQALEEKKVHVIERIKKTMDGLEKQRKESVDMIKENPKEADHHKQKVAHIATQIDDLVDKLKKIEMSKKQIEKNDKKKNDKKKDVKKDSEKEKKKVEEALVRALKEKKEGSKKQPDGKKIYISYKANSTVGNINDAIKDKLTSQGYDVKSVNYHGGKAKVTSSRGVSKESDVEISGKPKNFKTEYK